MDNEGRVPPEATLGAVLKAVQSLSTEVLVIRQKLEPLGRWTYIAIVVGSAFFGGVLTNLVLWLLGASFFGLHR